MRRLRSTGPMSCSVADDPVCGHRRVKAGESASTATASVLIASQSTVDDQGDGRGQFHGDGVADLTGYLGLAAVPTKMVRKSLDQGGLAVGDRPVLIGVQIAPLLRFEELGTDGDRRFSHTSRPMTSPDPERWFIQLSVESNFPLTLGLLAKSWRFPPLVMAAYRARESAVGFLPMCICEVVKGPGTLPRRRSIRNSPRGPVSVILREMRTSASLPCAVLVGRSVVCTFGAIPCRHSPRVTHGSRGESSFAGPAKLSCVFFASRGFAVPG